jgi:LysM repeat protein
VRGLAAAIAAGAVAVAVPPASAQGTGPVAHYRQVDEDQRRAIEYDLAWVGEGGHVIDGIIARNAIRAIRSFERSIGADDDGILRPEERRALARRSRAAQEEVGYRLVIDGVTGMRIGVPFSLLGGPRALPLGARYGEEDDPVSLRTYRITDGRPLRQMFDNQIDRAAREVTRREFENDRFTVAGRTGEGRAFHTEARAEGGEIRAYSLSYDPELDAALGPVVAAMASDLDAFAAVPSPDPAPRGLAAAPGCAERIRVPAGDTLARIAQRCGTAVSRLRRANGGLNPRELEAGQILRIPSAGEALPTLAELAPPPASQRARPEPAAASHAIHLPRQPREGGTVTVAAGGFPPESRVEAGISRVGDRFEPQTTARSDAEGRVDLTMEVPDRLRSGDRATAVIATADGRVAAATEPFTIREGSERSAARPARVERVISGMLTNEDDRCLTLRDSQGRLWSIREGGGRPYPAGTPVEVRGYDVSGGCDGDRVIEAMQIVRR